MESPKKSLVCNLNHVHLQHISLGLHLSRHPELREEAKTFVPPGNRTAYPACRQPVAAPETVDANSNHPSLACQCCGSHPLPPEVKAGSGRPEQALANGLALKQEEEEEEEEEEDLGSPSEPDTSSVSSCSDLSLDDTPVSCKAFPGEEVQSPAESQPNIVPLEDAQSLAPQAQANERSLNLNIQAAGCPLPRVWDSPDSLGSSSSLESNSNPASPSPQTLVERPLAGSSRPPQLAPPPPPPPPVRPCRAPPSVPVPPVGPGLDSNCNALPAETAQPKGLLLVDVNSNREAPPPRPRFGGVPPPVPPRTKRGLQGLRRGDAGKPTPETAPPEAEAQGDGGVKKNITSFHELAQKRKKAATGPPPPSQAWKEQSDWLIVFSPDTEFPPSQEAAWGSALSQERHSPAVSPPEPADPTAAPSREVTTFKELRYRKQKSQLAPKGPAQPFPLGDPGQGLPEGHPDRQESQSQGPPNGHLRGPKEAAGRRRKGRPGLQPILEGGLEEGEDGGGAKQRTPGRSVEERPNGERDPWVPGKEGRGNSHFTEAGPLPSCSSTRPPSRPFLVHVSLVDGPAVETQRPFSDSPSLESVELASPDCPGPAFCPRLQTLSCEEVCLLAGRQGQVLGALSPQELLPIRLSPIGAYSPPARGTLPFLESSDLAILFSPLFPRSRSYPTLAFPPCQVPEPPRGARGPLGSQAVEGPRRMTNDTMGDEEPGAPNPLRHSQSFGGIPSGRRVRRADMDRMSSQIRERKKALLVAVSASVDKIVAHFSSARNLVQKAQLGDSRISPDVGYLVLNTLCPALRALVSDGLKPFQKDVITGQRPSSAWSVVEASAKPGPSTRSLNALYWRVSRLAPLRNNQQRFHAFILGLLNMKQMEQWFTHLQQNLELISALYLPTAFLVLSQGVGHRWSEELLLLLQPLSMLTFQLDLLFEHHHLALEVRPTVPRQAAARPPGRTKEPALSLHAAETDSSGFSLVSFPELAGGLFEQRSPMDGAWPGATLPQRLLQWGDRLTHAWVGGEGCLRPEPNPEPSQTEPKEKPVGWWQQLSQASGVYVHHPAASPISKPEGFPYACWAKLRAAVGEALKEASPWMGETSPGANARPQRPGPGEQPAPASSSQRSRGDKTKVPTAGDHCNGDARAAEENPDALQSPGSGKGERLGWLFGAGSPGSAPELDSNLPKSRRPSSWFPPTMNVLALVMRTGPAEKSLQEGSWNDDGSPDVFQTCRAVRALCDHAGNGADHLSFRKGDVLQLLETVNEDWIRCCHGGRKGLVPVGYTSLLV